MQLFSGWGDRSSICTTLAFSCKEMDNI
uniref:Uncharacterized protein n=1 Tax=Arundo donax TaxID=35708 RepID=A0A0A9FR95_ARUDO